MSVTESKENYLEIIYILSLKNAQVRAIDIANYLGFSRASVSVALKLLKDANFINVEKGGQIFLTKTGKTIALKIYEKHKILSAWFMAMGVEEEIAIQDACKIEHIISEKSFEAIKNFLNKTK